MTRETAREIEADAARWVMRLNDDSNADQNPEFQAWLAGDSRRRGAFFQASAVVSAASIADQANRDKRLPEQTNTPRVQKSRKAVWASALAACLVLMVTVGTFLSADRGRYATDIGEIRRIPLADGSTAIINTKSKVSIALSDTNRDVELTQGEVWFQVAHDRARPFVVHSGDIRVRAIGTAFSVRRLADATNVIVNEGIVEVWTDGKESSRQRISAGTALLMRDQQPEQAKPVPANASYDLMWREGKVDLAGRSLRYAASEFNRYNARQLVIADPALLDEKLHGIFSVSDPVQFALAVRDGLNVPVDLAGNNDIVIGSSRDGAE